MESEEDQLQFSIRMMNISLSETDEYEIFLQIISRIGNIPKIIDFSIQCPELGWFIDIPSGIIEIDMLKHIEQTKVQLDRFIQKYLDGNNSDQVIIGHRKLSNLLNSLKSRVIEIEKQQKLQHTSQSKEEKKISQGFNEFEDILFDKNAPEQNTNKMRVRLFTGKNNSNIQVRDESSKEQAIKNELENEIYEMSQRMKNIASGIRENLKTDNEVNYNIFNDLMKLLKKIEKQQDNNQIQVKQSSTRIQKLLQSKSMSWITLIFMFLIATSLFIFTIVFIKLF